MHYPNRELMKMIIRPMYLILVFMISLSCNNEELFVEPVTEVIDEPVDDEEQDPEDTDDGVYATEPCGQFTG